MVGWFPSGIARSLLRIGLVFVSFLRVEGCNDDEDFTDRPVDSVPLDAGLL